MSGKFVFLLCIVVVQLSVYFAGGYSEDYHGRNAIAYAVDPLLGYEGSKNVQAFVGFLVSPLAIIIVVVFMVIEMRKKRT